MSEERPYQTLPEFQQAHEDLLERYDTGAGTPTSATDDEAGERACLVAVMEPLREFLRRAAAGGAYLYESRERRAAQGLLDYWASLCYGANLDLPRPLLAPHDPALLPKLKDEDCPYVGLEAFGERNAANFFGRGERVQALMLRLTHERVVVVAGASGSGKSSLVLAGLLPALRAGGLPGSANWAYPAALVPGAAPLASLAAALLPEATAADAEAWQARLRERPEALLEQLGDTPHVLVIDQFEEVMTLRSESNASEFNVFVAALQSMVDGGATPHRLVLTMRSDVDTQLAREYPALNRCYEKAAFPLVSMDSNQVREAIEGPAQRVGLKFQDGVVDELIRSVVGEDAGLPLLQFSLMALWDLRHGNLITLDALRTVGSPRRAMTVAAERLYGELLPDQQLVTENLFLALSRQGEGAAVFRNRVKRWRLHEIGEPPLVDRVVQRFEQARLLRVTHRDAPADDLVEVAHEALLRNWDFLQRLFAERRDERERRAFLRKQALKWREADFNDAFLLGGLALKQARDEIERAGMNEVERSFIDKSVEIEEAREREREDEYERRVRLAQQETLVATRLGRSRLVALSMVLVAAVVLLLSTALAWNGWRRTKAIADGAMADLALAESLSNVDKNSELSIVKALEAVGRKASLQMQAAGIIAESLRVRRAESSLPPQAAAATSALTLNGKGDRLLLALDKELVEWALPAGREPTRRKPWPAGNGRINYVGYALDGTAVVLATETGVWLWQGDELVELSPDLGLDVSRLSVSPDGQWLATVTEGGDFAHVWNLPKRELRLSYAAPKRVKLATVSFNEDATRLLVVPAPEPSRPAAALLFVRQGGVFAPRPAAVSGKDCTQTGLAFAAGGARVGLLMWPHLCMNTFGEAEGHQFATDTVKLDELADDIVFGAQGRFVVKLMRHRNEALVEDLSSGVALRLQGAFDLAERDSYEPLLSISGDGTRLAIKGGDGSVRLFALGTDPHQMAGRTGVLWISPDERLIITRAADGRGHELRETGSGRLLRNLKGLNDGNLPGLTLDASGKRMHVRASCEPGNRDAGYRVLVFDLTRPNADPSGSACGEVLGSGGDLYLVGDAKELQVYSVAAGGVIHRLPTQGNSRTAMRPARATAPGVELTSRGRFLVKEMNGERVSVKIFDSEGGKLVLKRELERVTPEGLAVGLRGGGRALLLASPAGSELWDLDAPTDAQPLRTEGRAAIRVDAHNGIAARHRIGADTWELLELGSWKLRRAVPAAWNVNTDTGFAVDPQDDQWALHSLTDSGEPRIVLPAIPSSESWSADHKTLAVRLADRVMVYDTESGQLKLETIERDGGPLQLSGAGRYLLMPDGRLVPSSAALLLEGARQALRERCQTRPDLTVCAGQPSPAASTSR